MNITELEPLEDTIEYAIGDVHGHLNHMMAALKFCAEDAAKKNMRGRVHLLGDYVDRGPNSMGVLEYLIQGTENEHMEWLPIRGNHDHVFLKTCKNDKYELSYEWWNHGGQQTLMSYGWDPVKHGLPSTIGEWVPDEHLDFITDMPIAHKVGDLLFVHAGIKPNKPLELQTHKDLMWIRNEFLKHGEDFGVKVIHGHSPEPENPFLHKNRIAMDSGCFYTDKLSIVCFEPNEYKPRFKTINSQEAKNYLNENQKSLEQKSLIS